MGEVEKAARALLRLVEFELDENRERQPWKGKLDALRAALEAEAGWKTVATSSDLEQGHEHRLQRRLLRETDDE